MIGDMGINGGGDVSSLFAIAFEDVANFTGFATIRRMFPPRSSNTNEMMLGVGSRR